MKLNGFLLVLSDQVNCFQKPNKWQLCTKYLRTSIVKEAQKKRRINKIYKIQLSPQYLFCNTTLKYSNNTDTAHIETHSHTDIYDTYITKPKQSSLALKQKKEEKTKKQNRSISMR